MLLRSERTTVNLINHPFLKKSDLTDQENTNFNSHNTTTADLKEQIGQFWTFLDQMEIHTESCLNPNKTVQKIQLYHQHNRLQSHNNIHCTSEASSPTIFAGIYAKTFSTRSVLPFWRHSSKFCRSSSVQNPFWTEEVPLKKTTIFLLPQALPYSHQGTR